MPIEAADSSLPCLVRPHLVVAVGSPVAGVLQSVEAGQGDVVTQGQVLATLESSVERAQVEVARSKAEMEAREREALVRKEFAKSKVARARDLTKSAAIASLELEEAEKEERLAEVAHQEALEAKRVAQHELRLAEAALALRTIRSPIDGVVVERYMTAGDLVKQSPIMKLAQLDPLLVDVAVPASRLGKLAAGIPAEVRLDSGMAAPSAARVTGMSPLVDPATSTVTVSLLLPNPRREIPAGVTCTVRFPSK